MYTQYKEQYKQEANYLCKDCKSWIANWLMYAKYKHNSFNTDLSAYTHCLEDELKHNQHA